MDRTSFGLRLFFGLVGIGCVALVVMAVVAISTGGYRPERYTGGFDPVWASFLVFSIAVATAFVMLAAAGLVAHRRERAAVAPQYLLFAFGLAVLGLTLVGLAVVWWPRAGGQAKVAPLLQLGALAGLGMIGLAMVIDAAPRVGEGVRNRDPGMLLGLLLLAVIIAIGVINRL